MACSGHPLAEPLGASSAKPSGAGHGVGEASSHEQFPAAGEGNGDPEAEPQPVRPPRRFRQVRKGYEALDGYSAIRP